MTGLMTVAEREAALLAPYAVTSRSTAGRRFPEPEHPYRGPYQRDRDRIVHSSAYRRLSGKMQVFTGEMGDYHRTRLTHTQEVASIARTMGRALRLNEDFIEALALLHDIGHPPFGHAGEAALHACLQDELGFSHNQHALTIVEELEIRYPFCIGLNLSAEVLAGQRARQQKQRQPISPLLEVQVVDLADSVTYDAHDTDDAVTLGIVTLDELAEEVAIVRTTLHKIRQRYGGASEKLLRKMLVRELIELQVSDILQGSGKRLADACPPSPESAAASGLHIRPSAELAEKKLELERFLYQRVYRHPRLMEVREAAQAQLTQMFHGFLQHLDWLPSKFQRRVTQAGPRRAVAEFLAGMTDRYCNQQYEERFATRAS
jgi:dGTPase